jgi:type III restriction-modification system methylation subunit
MNKLDMQSIDIVDENIEKISELFPNVIVESANGKTIDFDLLKQELSKEIVDGVKEKYQLTWPGKKEAIVNANTPSKNTLRPIKEKSVDFDNTKNIYIEGDNLEVLKILQESYLNKIKCIYIDPPYNTGSDFIYNDKFSKSENEELIESGQIDEDGNRMISNNQSNGKFHSDWLSMMFSRLKLARNLLSKDGLIFVSIDDNEQANLKKVCDEIFGEKNFIGIFCINSTPNARDYGHIGKMHEYALFYAKNIDFAKSNMIPEEDKKFTYSDEIGGFNIHPLYNSNEAFTPANRPNLYYPFYVNPNSKTKDGFYEIGLENRTGWIEVYPPKSVKNGVQFVWRWGKEEKSRANLNKEIVGYKVDNEFKIVQKMRNSAKLIRSFLYDGGYTSRKGTTEVEEIIGSKIFSFPKPVELIKLFLKSGSNEDSIVLDFFSGSGTTAQAVMELNNEDNGNRRFILVQLPEKIDKKEFKTICDLGQERIRRVANKLKQSNSQCKDLGFRVYKTDSSNMKDIFYKPNDLEQSQLRLFESNIKEDRTTDDLLTQVILDLGLTLDLDIEERMIGDNKVYYVAGNSLVACFDDNIDINIVDKICECEPYKVVFKDSAFKYDNDKINLEERFKKLLPQRASDEGFINIL